MHVRAESTHAATPESKGTRERVRERETRQERRGARQLVAVLGDASNTRNSDRGSRRDKRDRATERRERHSSGAHRAEELECGLTGRRFVVSAPPPLLRVRHLPPSSLVSATLLLSSPAAACVACSRLHALSLSPDSIACSECPPRFADSLWTLTMRTTMRRPPRCAAQPRVA